ncbi:MAG: hypothetical protein ACMUHM_02720 [Thermoplasmatota archaeon]
MGVHSKVSKDTDISESTGSKSLSDREFEVLKTIISFPGFNSSQQSRSSGMNHSTFVNIKGRLLSEGFVRKVYIPSLWAMGGDVIHLSMDHSPRGGWEDIGNEGLWSSREGSIFEVFDDQLHLSMNVFSNFRDLYLAKEEWQNEILKMGSRIQRESVELSCEGLSFLNLFDHAGVLSETGGPIEDSPLVFPSRNSEIRSSVTQTVQTLVEDPEGTSKDLAAGLGMNRQTFTILKERAEADHLAIPRYLPRLGKLGFTIIGVFIFPLVENAGADHIDELHSISKSNRGHIFFDMLSLNTEVILTAHRNFDDFQSKVRTTMAEHVQRKLISRPPIVAPICLQEGRSFGSVQA